jgi:hypothetical protein
VKPDSAPAESRIGRADRVASPLGCPDASVCGRADEPAVRVIVFGPLVAALWLVMLTYLVRAATAASQGLAYTVPRWLCSPIVR